MTFKKIWCDVREPTGGDKHQMPSTPGMLALSPKKKNNSNCHRGTYKPPELPPLQLLSWSHTLTHWLQYFNLPKSTLKVSWGV